MDEINSINERLKDLDRMLNNENYCSDDWAFWEAVHEKEWLEHELEEAYTRIWERDTIVADD